MNGVSSRIAQHRTPPVLWIVPAFTAVGMLLPLLYLGLRAFEADPAALAELVFRRRTWELLRNTSALTAGVLVATTAIAFPLAWLTVRTDLRAHGAVTVLAVVPLAIPGYVMAHALLGLGGANGIAARLGLEIARPSGWLGATLALSLYAYPYLFLNLRSALSAIDPGVEESARSLGYGPSRVFWHVVLPMAAPGLVAGWVIVALYTLGDFGAVALMRYEVFSYAIYTQYAAAFDRTYASALALLLIALTVPALYLDSRLARRGSFARSGVGASRRAARTPLGRRAVAAWLFIAVVLGASVGLPFLSLAYWMSVTPPWMVLPRVARNFGSSMTAALPAAGAAVALALPIAYLRVRYPGKAARAAERLAYVGYAVPPLALALAFVFFALRAAPFLYQRLPLLIAAYALNFLALAMGPIRSTLFHAPRRLEEAARSLGRTAVQAFVGAVLPVLRRGILASFTLVFVMAMKELPIAFLLAPTGFTTLSVAVFTRTSEAMYAEAAPFAAAIVILSTMFVGLMVRYEGHH